MKYYVLCVSYDIVEFDNEKDAIDMCTTSNGFAVFDKEPIFKV